MSAEKRAAPANHLLAAVFRHSRLDLSARCEQIDLSFAQVIFELGDRIRYVYFQIDSRIPPVTFGAKCEPAQ